MDAPRAAVETLESRTFMSVGNGTTPPVPVDFPTSPPTAATAKSLVVRGQVSRPPTAPGPAGALDVRTFGATPNDATDDRTAIQRGMDAAASQNKTLYIPRGTYLLSSFLFLPSNLRVQGDRGLSVLKMQDGITNQRMIYGSGVQNVTLHNLVLDANRDRTTTTTGDSQSGEGTCVTVTSRFDTGTQRSIESANIEISNSVIRNGHHYGVYLLDVDNGRILNNTVRDCGRRGIYFVTGGGAGTSRNNLVSGNFVERIDLRDPTTRAPRGVGSGIAFAGTPNDAEPRIELFTVSNNTTRLCGRAGILTEFAQDFTISGNVSYSNRVHTVLGKGIQVSQASDRGTIENNTCYDNTGGIDIDTIRNDNRVGHGDFTVRGNRAFGNRVHGIHVNHTRDVRVENNLVYNNDYGILLTDYGTDDCTVSGNVAHNNLTSGIGLSSLATFRTSTGLTVPSWVNNVTITGNRMYRNGLTGLQNDLHKGGLLIMRGSGITVTGNVFEANNYSYYVDPASRTAPSLGVTFQNNQIISERYTSIPI